MITLVLEPLLFWDWVQITPVPHVPCKVAPSLGHVAHLAASACNAFPSHLHYTQSKYGADCGSPEAKGNVSPVGLLKNSANLIWHNC